jgi:Tfp pilus assembly protein PilO
MIKHLATVDPRRVPLFAAAFVVLVAAALATYLVWPQLKAQRAAAVERSALQEVVGAATTLTAQRLALQDEVQQLELALYADGADAAHGTAPTLESRIMTALQQLASRNALRVESMRPIAGTQIEPVRETLFELELTGAYADLHGWLRAVRANLDAVVVRELVFSPLDDSADPELRAVLTLAAYRSVP